jgi:hypothetical protein
LGNTASLLGVVVPLRSVVPTTNHSCWLWLLSWLWLYSNVQAGMESNDKNYDNNSNQNRIVGNSTYAPVLALPSHHPPSLEQQQQQRVLPTTTTTSSSSSVRRQQRQRRRRDIGRWRRCLVWETGLVCAVLLLVTSLTLPLFQFNYSGLLAASSLSSDLMTVTQQQQQQQQQESQCVSMANSWMALDFIVHLHTNVDADCDYWRICTVRFHSSFAGLVLRCRCLDSAVIIESSQYHQSEQFVLLSELAVLFGTDRQQYYFCCRSNHHCTFLTTTHGIHVGPTRRFWFVSKGQETHSDGGGCFSLFDGTRKGFARNVVVVGARPCVGTLRCLDTKILCVVVIVVVI